MSTTSISTAKVPAAETMTRPQARLESIDGLRGLACLSVLLFHSCDIFGRIAWPRLSVGSFPLTQSHLFAYGYGGVDLFFVLSGFCLAYPIVSRPERAVNWKQYAINRVRRIIPPYWAAMLLFGCLSLWSVHHPLQPAGFPHVLVWPGLHSIVDSLLLFIVSLNPAFWTLPIEWRWYFVLPILILLWRRIGGAGLLLCLVPISLLSIFLFMPSHLVRLQTIVSPLLSYLSLFGFGIWAASLAAGQEKYSWERRIKPLATVGVVLTLLIVVALAPLYSSHYDGERGLLRLLTWGPFCFFLVLAATQEGRIRQLFSWHPLVGVGTFSYSLYLVHEPFLYIVAAFVLSRHWLTSWVLLWQIIIIPTVLVGFSYLFFLVAEKPFLRRPVKKAIEAEQHGLTSKAAAEAG